MGTTRPKIPELDDLRGERHVCLGEQLRAANRAIAKCYADHLRGVDVNAGQLSLLIRLYYLGDVAITKLARHLETDRTTVARNVQVLEDSGHVAIVEAADKRSRLVRLTDKGAASLQAALPLWRNAQEDLRRRFGPALWATLFKNLRTLAEVDRIGPAPIQKNLMRSDRDVRIG